VNFYLKIKCVGSDANKSYCCTFGQKFVVVIDHSLVFVGTDLCNYPAWDELDMGYFDC